MELLLLCLVRYLFSMVHANRFLPRSSKEDVLSRSIIIVGNVSIARQTMPLVATPLLDYVMIH